MTDLRLTIHVYGRPTLEVALGAFLSIGRAADNTIRVDEASVSRYHAVIERRDGSLWVRDLCSSNGTTVNGTTVECGTEVSAGDRIEIAGIALLVVGETRSHDESAMDAGRAR